MTVQDTEGTTLDVGRKGRKFEHDFIEALRLVGLAFETNRTGGAAWDIHPKGPGWQKIVDNKDVNIKLTQARWLFGSSELGKSIPWDDFSPEDEEKVVRVVRKVLNQWSVPKVVFLKPKDQEVQSALQSAVRKKDCEALSGLLVRKNFNAVSLGHYSIRILSKGSRINSIVLEKGGKVFARTERPRKVGHSLHFVAFRAPTPKISKINRRLKVPESRALMLLGRIWR